MKRKIINSISAKIILLFVITNFLISIVAAYSSNNSMKILENNSIEESQYNLDLAINQIDNDLSNVKSFIYTYTSTNADFVTMNSNYSGDRYYISSGVVRNTIKLQLSGYQFVSGMFVYVPERKDLLTVIKYNSLDEFLGINQYITNYAAGEEQKIWHIITVDNQDYIVWIKKYDKAYFGAFGKVDNILKELNLLEYYTNKTIYFTPKNKLVHIDKKKYIKVISASLKDDYQLTGLITKAEIFRSIPVTSKITLGLAIASLLSIPFLVICLKIWLITPLTRIKKAMEEIKHGNMDYKIKTRKSSYEFSQINETFNKMTGEITALKIENYEKKLEQQRADFQILQLKVNPHFLLNSFNIIYSMAQIKEYKAIQNLSTYLSNYFRYIFNNGCELVELSKEINFIKDYLAISAMRFPDTFHCNYDIDEELKEFKILPLLIQNFVENIIKYAIELGGCIEISIKAKNYQDRTEISVTDTGKGMEQNLVEKIMAGEMKGNSKGSGTGIINSRKRLNYFYGDRAEIIIKSKLYEGTQILIIILKEMEEKHGKFTDC
ncbi:MAG: histidine kinase [Anaerocolumna sp.]